MAAGRPSARPHVNEVVRRANRVLVVLDDENGVAERLEAAQRAEQALVVALMQADARLVEHVEHARQPRADLRREPDALALAAGERGAAAGEGEVVEAHVHEELQALLDLAQDAPGDLLALGRELGEHAREPRARAGDGQVAGLGDVGAGDADGERLGLEARSVADGAGLLGLVAGQLLAHPGAIGLLEAALQVAQYALERLVDRVAPDAVLVAELDRLLVGAVQDRVADPLRQVVPGRTSGDLVVPGEALQRLVVVGRLGAGPGRDGAVSEAGPLVGDDKVGIEEALDAESVAGRAGAVGRVEAEQARLDLLDGEAALGTGKARGEHRAGAAIRVLGVNDAVREGERRLEGVGETLLQAWAARLRGPRPPRSRA